MSDDNPRVSGQRHPKTAPPVAAGAMRCPCHSGNGASGGQEVARRHDAMNATEPTSRPDAKTAHYQEWADEHPNVITPNRTRIETVGPYVVEVAHGRGLRRPDGHRPTIWGVSVLVRTGDGYESINRDGGDPIPDAYDEHAGVVSANRDEASKVAASEGADALVEALAEHVREGGPA